MAGRVCVDASLALMLLIPHDLTPKAEALWQSWSEEDLQIVAPPLFFAEVTSVLRESVYFGRVPPAEAEHNFTDFLDLGVKSIELPDLQPRAWALAKQYNRPRAYDAQYLAVASALGCDLWTGDRRLVNALSVSWLKWVGEYAAHES